MRVSLHPWLLLLLMAAFSLTPIPCARAEAGDGSKLDELFSTISSGRLEDIRSSTKRLLQSNEPAAYDRLTRMLLDSDTDVNRRIEILRGIKASPDVRLLDGVLGCYLQKRNDTECSEARETLLSMDADTVADRLATRACDRLTVVNFRKECIVLLQEIVTRDNEYGICLRLAGILESPDNEALYDSTLATLRFKTELDLGPNAADWSKELKQLMLQQDPLKIRIQELEAQLETGKADYAKLQGEYIQLKLEYLAVKDDPALYVKELEPDRPDALLIGVLDQARARKIYTEDCQQKILVLLKHDNIEIRVAAVGMAGLARIESSVQTLAEALESPNEALKGAAMVALSRLGESGLPHWKRVREMLFDQVQSIELRSRAVTALAAWARLKDIKAVDHAEITAALQDAYVAAEQSVRLRYEIVHALQNIEFEITPVTDFILERALVDTDANVRLEAIRQVRNTKLLKYKPYLISALGDEQKNIRDEASGSLATLLGAKLLSDDDLYAALATGKPSMQNETAEMLAPLARAAFSPESLTQESAPATLATLQGFCGRLDEALQSGARIAVEAIMSALPAENFTALAAQIQKLKPASLPELLEFYFNSLSDLYGRAQAPVEALRLLEFLQTQTPDLPGLPRRIAFAEFKAGNYTRSIELLKELPKSLKLARKDQEWWTIQYTIVLAHHCLGSYEVSTQEIDALTPTVEDGAPAEFAQRLAELRAENERVAALAPESLAAVRADLNALAAGTDAEKQAADAALRKPERLAELIDMLRVAETPELFQSVTGLLSAVTATPIDLKFSDTTEKKALQTIQLRKKLAR